MSRRRRAERRQRRWLWAQIGIASVAFAAFGYVLSGVMARTGDRSGVPAPFHGSSDSLQNDPVERDLRRAGERRPVIEMRDLAPLALGPQEADAVRPHLRFLNDALILLSDLHREYDAARDAAERRQIQAEAVAIHARADRHENAIHSLLSPDQERLFHQDLSRREQALGLPPDEWHRDAPEGSVTPLVGVQHQAGEVRGKPEPRLPQ